ARTRAIRSPTATVRPTRFPTSTSRGRASLRPQVHPTRPTRSWRCRCAAPSGWRRSGARSPGETARWATAASPLPPRKCRLARLEARQQLERVLAFDGALIVRREAPVRNAPVDLRAIAEGIVSAVEYLGDGHHLEQRRDLARRVALRQLVKEFPELGQRTVGQVCLLALLGEANEAAGQERQRAATVAEDPANVRKPRGGATEHYMRDGARGVGRVFDRCRRDAR